MAYCFGDGFDLYATSADPVAGFWDSGSTNLFTLAAGRFAGGQAASNLATAGAWLVKSSTVTTDPIHHIVVAYRQTVALTGTTLVLYLQLSDVATNQCCVVFRSDGTILLTSATPAGTVLATYSSAVTAQNTWFAFEFEVIINASTGRFRARKNGNTVDDFDSGATLNTRPGANTQANKLTVGLQTSTGAGGYLFDDLLWRSDATTLAFLGDIRCYARLPITDASTQFARAPSPAQVAQTAASSATTSKAANLGIMSAFTAAYTGTIASGIVQITTGATGNMKAAIYDSTRTTALATSNAVVNPVAGGNTITFGTPLTVSKGTTYYLAVDQDATIVYTTTGATQFSFTTTYASFPAASPTTAASAGPVFTVAITPTVSAEYVNEAQQDGTTSYVYDSTAAHADFYNIASLIPQPASVVAVTTRGYINKSDAGTRTGTVQIKSGGTTVAAPTITLSTSFGWAWRTDTTNPSGGAAWTASAVDGVQIGPLMMS